MPTLEPGLDQLVRRALDDRLADLHTCALGRVLAYHSDTDTADVQLITRRPVPTADGETDYEDQPTLRAIPVLVFGTSRSFVQAPVQPGDRVLCLFAEDGAEAYAGSESVDVVDLARHSLSGGVAVPIVLGGSVGKPLALLEDVQKVLDLIKNLTTTPASTDPSAWALTAATALKYAAAATTLTGTVEVKAK